MIVLGIFILFILLLVVPTVVGAGFVNVDKNSKKLPFMWIYGQIVLWAGFQLISVPVVLMKASFNIVVAVFSVYTLVFLGMGICFLWKNKEKKQLYSVEGIPVSAKKWYKPAWVIFAGLLLFQLFQAVFMVYADGDDAFYVAISGMAENSNTMYQQIAYTGWPSALDVRHGMAPFPVWIAWLTRLSGIKAVSVNHIAVPLALISMTYAIYYLLACKLFAKKKEVVPVFLIFTELLVLFGDYSFYTVENFMIARSRQGKAALGSIIIPALFLLLLILLEKLQEGQRLSKVYWILLGAAMTAGCLCSTMGALLVCMLIGITGLCGAVCYRRWKFLFPMAACCIPCVVYAGLYLILG